VTTEDTALLSMLQTALSMEEKGFAFYDEALNKTTNLLGKELFTTLRDDEIVHVARIKRIFKAVTAGQDWAAEFEAMKTDPEELQQMFQKLAKAHGSGIKGDSDDLDALQVGVDFELRAVQFYEAHLPKAVSALERDFTTRMVNEERAHHKALVDTKLFLTDPEDWYREAERTGLDGA
jgi:rubrerythrin